MARNIWDVSDILLQQRAGDIQGNMFANLGQQIGAGLQQYGEMKKQNKAMEGEIGSTIKFLESARDMVKNDPKRSSEIDQTLSQLHDPNVNLIQRYSMAKGAGDNIIKLVNLGEAAQKQEIAAAQAKALQLQNAQNEWAQNLYMGAQGQPATQGRVIPGISGVVNGQMVPVSPASGAAPAQGSNGGGNLIRQFVQTYGLPPENANDLMRFRELLSAPQAKPTDRDVVFQSEIAAWQENHPGETMNATVMAKLAKQSYLPNTPAQISLPPGTPGYSTRYDPNTGEVTTTPIPGSPELKKKEESKQRIGGNIKRAIGNIIQLNDIGAIVNPENDILSNVKARISASGIGQSASGAMGTKAQSLRNKLNNLTPILIQDIKQATGMSAQEMNSNVELQFRIKQVGDDSMDIVSRLAALDNIDRNYGDGNSLETMLQDNPDLIEQVRGSLTPMESESNEPKFVEGMVYEDANGIKAKRQNGKWIKL